MAIYEVQCEQCGAAFQGVRARTQNPPRYCSIECRSRARGPAQVLHRFRCVHCGQRAEKWRPPGDQPKYCSPECYRADKVGRTYPRSPGSRRRGRVKVGTTSDGRAIYMQHSHWVWNREHPDDPVREGELIHHLDGNPANDDPSNLVKMNFADHSREHANQIERAERSRRMLAYHAANPGKHRRGKPKQCPVCGAEFYRPPSAKAETCSYKCMGRLRSMRAGKTPTP